MGLITYTNLEDGTPVTANIFNERFAQIVAELNGNIAAVNMLDAGITKEKLAAEVYESIYPVGSMYVNFTDDTDPATLLGFGTWTAVAGRVVAGYDGTQTDFNAAEKTGGSKDAVVVAHTHNIVRPRQYAGEGTGGNTIYGTNAGTVNEITGVTLSAGESGTGKNLQPYIVGYIWKRVS